MAYNRFTISVFIRIVLILCTMLALIMLWGTPNRLVTTIFFGLMILFQAYWLARFATKLNRDFANFLINLKESDNIHVELPEKLRNQLSDVDQSLKTIKTEIVQSRVAKVSQEQYFEHVIENLNEGLLSFDEDGIVEIFNPEAKRLLQTEKPSNIWDLELKFPKLPKSLVYLKPGNSKLVKLLVDEKQCEFLFNVSEIKIHNKQLKVVSFKDFKNELEEKELSAWRKLIRVLNHEIMNSITPITTLTVANRRIFRKKQNEISSEDISDLFKNNDVIESRSKGLLGFIEQYRTLTRIPEPELTQVPIKSMFNELETIYNSSLIKSSINLQIEIEPESLEIKMDRKLIMQVLINLFKNSLEALNGIDQKEIKLIAGRNFIHIWDNGIGIKPEEMEQVFVPFFTTKKSGSGIGLSLSKQIMKLHKGEINIESKAGNGTKVCLCFEKI